MTGPEPERGNDGGHGRDAAAGPGGTAGMVGMGGVFGMDGMADMEGASGATGPEGAEGADGARSAEGAKGVAEGAAPVPPYVVTAGRSRADTSMVLDLVTLVVTRPGSRPTAEPEPVAILRMCGNPLSVAEISAHLRLPFSVVTLLLTDLVARGWVEVREVRGTTPAATEPDIEILKALIDGLQRL